ncbi:MAG: GNAT family N-acetyltransferase [Candidatus Omnitrophica bacterium]|nr:GNAT family N-acetyltransferase [Candidatus Omnitrophota bacterium]
MNFLSDVKNQESTAHIKGERIYLREINVSDVNERYLGWMNDSEVTRHLLCDAEKWTLGKLKKYVKKMKKDPNSIFFGIFLNANETHIGNLKIGSIDYRNNFADIGLLIGERTMWGQGYASEAIRLAVDFSFNTLNLHKLTASVLSINIGSVRVFQKCGFSIEGKREKQYFYDGDYQDSILFGIIKK